jgi:hypothetical protein
VQRRRDERERLGLRQQDAALALQRRVEQRRELLERRRGEGGKRLGRPAAGGRAQRYEQRVLGVPGVGRIADGQVGDEPRAAARPFDRSVGDEIGPVALEARVEEVLPVLPLAVVPSRKSRASSPPCMTATS